MRTSAPAGLLAILAILALPATAAELPELAVPQGLGVNIHFTHPQPGEMKMLAAGGFRWLRMDFAWGATEREKGQYDFQAYDHLLAEMEKHHMRGLWIFDYSNPHYDEGLSPYTDSGRQAFAGWAAAAAQHFRGHGILWEMYNEPNIHFWKPKPDVDAYVKLALATGRALREAAPEELYIGPATSRIDLAFLEKCFQGGLLDYWCAVSIHPYRQSAPETAAPEYAQLRQLIEKYAGKHIPILAAEWGFSSVWKKFDDALQGKYLPREYLMNLANQVPLTIWYDWHDDGQDPRESEHHFGTVAFPYHAGRDPVYDPKPAYTAAKSLVTALDGFAFKERLAFGGEPVYALVFTKGDQTRWAVWTTADAPQSITLPLPAGRYTVTDHLGHSQPPLTADEKGVTITLTDAPQYVARP
jgi:hypothetical protein